MLLVVDEFRSGQLGQRPVEVIVRDIGADAEPRPPLAEAGGGRGRGDRRADEQRQHRPHPAGRRGCGVLLISPTASAVKFHGKDDNLFRINATTRDNGRHYAEHYYARGIRRIAVAVNQNNRAFSESWLQEFRRAYEAVGGTVLIAPFFDSNAPSYEPVVHQLLAERPDGVLFIGNAVDSARLAQQVHKLRPGTPMIVAEWAGTSQLIELGGKAVEGLMLVQNYNQEDDSPRFRAFQDAYRKRFGKAPVYSSVLTYDAGIAVLTALARRDAGMRLKDALLRFGPYEGLQQKVGFDANGDAQRVAHFMMIKDGHFVRE
jgi:branched-chain amino acid transport system substrate-binding protein